jgi:Lysozyme like domain
VAVLLLLALAGGALAIPRRTVPPLTMPPGPKPGNGHLSLAELTLLAAAAGFPDPPLAAAVAMAESSGYPHAQGDPRGPFLAVPNGVSQSFGLWQINSPAHPEFDPSQLLDATYNAHAAFLVSKGGRDFTPWTMYRNGQYQQFVVRS